MRKRNPLLPPLIAMPLLLSFNILNATESEVASLHSFLAGSYILIGREVDSDVPITGRVTLTETKEGLTLTRTIENRNVMGSGNIETVTADHVPVLRLHFSERSIAYEATCLIGSDLDNYARLTCQRYRADGTTRSPGFEALFAAPRP